MTDDTTFLTEIVKETAKWLVPFIGAFAAVFFTPLLDAIKFRLNRADLRSKQFEEFACDLSAFIFAAELMHEFHANKWDVGAVIEDYNTAVTTFRTKEFVYLSWARRFWPSEDYLRFEAVNKAVREIDEAIHAFNNGKSTPQKIAAIDREIAPLRILAESLLAPIHSEKPLATRFLHWTRQASASPK